MILFLDDEPKRAMIYVDEMRGLNLPVRYFSAVDEALGFVRRKQKRLDLAIVDVMMSPGNAYASRPTRKGLYTGLEFIKDIRALEPACPIIVLTNFNTPDVMGLEAAYENLRVVLKPSVFYDDLAQQVKTEFDAVRRQRPSLGGDKEESQ